jgi:uncharacterized protein (DUF433 family)
MHPHITKNPDVCGGSPVISGTRFPVRSIVFFTLKISLTPEEIVEKFPHLSLAQIYDALAYYYDNRSEIEQDILENTEETVREPKD